jgi:septum formation protein
MRFLNELCNLEGKKIILASQSPRRIEMLHSLGLEFEIYPARVDESPESYRDEIEYVYHNAASKAEWVYQKHPSAGLVISADTIVVKDGRILEKPKDSDDAGKMLKMLSGATHQVVTGICLLTSAAKIIDHEITNVTFVPLSGREIDAYLASGEPFDKAGAYGIQGFASIFIQRIEGCYFNVVGFPIAKFYQHLREIRL